MKFVTRFPKLASIREMVCFVTTVTWFCKLLILLTLLWCLLWTEIPVKVFHNSILTFVAIPNATAVPNDLSNVKSRVVKSFFWNWSFINPHTCTNISSRTSFIVYSNSQNFVNFLSRQLHFPLHAGYVFEIENVQLSLSTLQANGFFKLFF